MSTNAERAAEIEQRYYQGRCFFVTMPRDEQEHRLAEMEAKTIAVEANPDIDPRVPMIFRAILEDLRSLMPECCDAEDA